MLVFVDDDANGWRRLVIPIAHSDELVKSAVISASTFCAAPFLSGQLPSPEVAYQKVIRGLRQRQNLVAQDLRGKQCVLLTLLILVANVIVNGSSDFRVIFALLQASFRAMRDGEEFFRGDLGLFISTQISK